MSDVMTKEQRKKTMSKIRSRSKLEDKVSKALWARGYRFRKNVKSLRGTPDIVIKKYKIVIFIDSCFWHVCPEHGNFPESNTQFWRNKLQQNKKRDEIVTTYYKQKGWFIMRVWEHELNNNVFDGTIDKISTFIDKAKKET
ncbi:very short patch repair endonuclease [Pseudalkalibacillus sp. Hm43]|uniref:very short patch repair endonuclease n=1 Tax=Pseudalkalibacillus sp. Hm43 TaxID=3450742 RepID=UPI003F43F482